MNKPYSCGDKKAHEKSDKTGKDTVIEILHQWNVRGIKTNEKEAQGDFSGGKWDISFLYRDKIIKNECEARPGQGKNESNPFDLDPVFPWPYSYSTIDIPFRKSPAKGGVSHFYWVVCTKFPVVFRFSISNLDKTRIVEKVCSNFGKLENFCRIPCELGNWFHKVNGIWVPWKES